MTDRKFYDKVHEIKSWPQFFYNILNGERMHELRYNDRDYRVNDYLLLRLWDPDLQEYCTLTAMARITSITSQEVPCAVSDNGLMPGYCILSIKVLK